MHLENWTIIHSDIYFRLKYYFFLTPAVEHQTIYICISLDNGPLGNSFLFASMHTKPIDIEAVESKNQRFQILGIEFQGQFASQSWVMMRRSIFMALSNTYRWEGLCKILD